MDEGKKTIVITGPESSLGFELARAAKAARMNIIPVRADSIKAGMGEIHLAIKGGAEFFGVDRVDYVINNYGINHLSSIGETPSVDEEILKVNVMGPYWVVNSIKSLGLGPSRVVNVASATHRVSQRKTAIYCASKAALVHMTRVMARELAPEGWVINSVSPGKIEDTVMATTTDAQVNEIRGWSPEEAEIYALSIIPMKRFTNRAEIAEAIFKVLALPDYINGANIDAMGGV